MAEVDADLGRGWEVVESWMAKRDEVEASWSVEVRRRDEDCRDSALGGEKILLLSCVWVVLVEELVVVLMEMVFMLNWTVLKLALLIMLNCVAGLRWYCGWSLWRCWY